MRISFILILLFQAAGIYAQQKTPLLSVDPNGGDVIIDGRKGWTQIAEGVWEFQFLDGRVEHYAFGDSGTAWMLEKLRNQTHDLYESWWLEPTAEKEAQLQNHVAFILSVEEELAATEDAPAPEVETSCYSVAASCNTDAGQITGGVFATASASWKSANCSGEVYAYAQACANGSCASDYCGPQTGLDTSCNAYKSNYGSSSCSSYAVAYFGKVGGVKTWCSDSYSGPCGPNPPTASLSGCPLCPGAPRTYCLTCSGSGGTPPYSYEWRSGYGWYSGGATEQFTDAGSFTVECRVKDANGIYSTAASTYCGGPLPLER